MQIATENVVEVFQTMQSTLRSIKIHTLRQSLSVKASVLDRELFWLP